MSDKDLSIHELVVVKQMENKIRGLLLDLDEQLIDVGTRVCGVHIDTRNFANMKIEIHTINRQIKK